MHTKVVFGSCLPHKLNFFMVTVKLNMNVDFNALSSKVEILSTFFQEPNHILISE